MVKKFSFLLLLVLLSSLVVAEADCIYYFSSTDCPTCDAVNEHLVALENANSDLQVERFEAYYNQKHANLLQDFYIKFKVPEESQAIPIVFMPGSYLVGPSAINDLLEGRLDENEVEACPNVNDKVIGVLSGDTSPGHVLKTINFFSVTGDAFKDAFHPGMIAAFLVFLALLSMLKDDTILVKRGIIFVLIIYVISIVASMMMSSGFGSRANSLFYRLIGILVIVVSIGRIKMFLGTWKLLAKSIPEQLKEYGSKSAEFISSYWGFSITAVLMAFFTISQANRTLLIFQNLFQSSGYKSIVFPYLLYYKLIVVLPLILLIGIFYFLHNKVEDLAEENAKSEYKIKSWIKHYHKILRFSASVVMLIIGLVLLFV
tara:strand:- start:1323 stop:2441 length:1119 start_codon:yes stop_codon:yes gene_type:complete